MSAERLREAARVLRERAGEAASGPWREDVNAVRPTRGPDRTGALALAYGLGPSHAWANAAYIATVHPGVGVAVADWLDYVAEAWPDAPYGHALAVADAILGGAS